MQAMGFDVSKKFTRWLDKLVRDDRIALYGENIVPLSKRGTWGCLLMAYSGRACCDLSCIQNITFELL
ncbi:hypothetical protein DAQ1742_04098 [Dickeya aquatica]|uniref:Uncharacterized protein n=1 Tax=Dickeya aquatica TaxID=1401087 RepID=A0A375AFQ0_9GAMM|nr:hypothetical protein DAQ1742_04098 [Dickeya aquatica]